MPGKKTCRTCRKRLSTAAFNDAQRTADGLADQCRACTNARRRELDGQRKERRRLTDSLAGALFCMDSALECLVFALNALGNAVDASAFRDVRSRKALSRISPRNVLGNANEKALSGYAKYFPTFQQRWLRSSDVINLVCDNHDVSKHRQATFWGGTLRDDPPEMFRRALDVDDRLTIFSPMAEVLLPRDPKAPMVELKSDLEHWVLFEELDRDLSSLVSDSLNLAATDATNTIRLNENALRDQSTA